MTGVTSLPLFYRGGGGEVKNFDSKQKKTLFDGALKSPGDEARRQKVESIGERKYGMCGAFFVESGRERLLLGTGIRGHGGEGYRYPPPEGQSSNPPSCWTLY